MTKILFLCTGNSCRSQMAEGWARHLNSDVLEPYSAGIETHGLNPNAVKVMAVTHVGFDDPPRLAGEAATEEEALSHYRRVRDEIRTFVEALPETLDS